MSDNELYILWTTDNVATTEKMVFMYALNAKKAGWWDNIVVIVWGASAVLAAENVAIQKQLAEMQEAGVKVTACIACAKELGVADKLKNAGIDLRGWGPPLTEILKSGGKLITV